MTELRDCLRKALERTCINADGLFCGIPDVMLDKLEEAVLGWDGKPPRPEPVFRGRHRKDDSSMWPG